MFGDQVGFATTDKRHASDEYNADVDKVVKQILDVSVSFVHNSISAGLILARKYFNQHERCRVEAVGQVFVRT